MAQAHVQQYEASLYDEVPYLYDDVPLNFAIRNRVSEVGAPICICLNATLDKGKTPKTILNTEYVTKPHSWV